VIRLLRAFLDDAHGVRVALERYVRIRERDQRRNEAVSMVSCTECYSTHKEWHYGKGPDWKCPKCGKVLVQL
jgi:rubrerythrin